MSPLFFALLLLVVDVNSSANHITRKWKSNSNLGVNKRLDFSQLRVNCSSNGNLVNHLKKLMKGMDSKYISTFGSNYVTMHELSTLNGKVLKQKFKIEKQKRTELLKNIQMIRWTHYDADMIPHCKIHHLNEYINDSNSLNSNVLFVQIDTRSLNDLSNIRISNENEAQILISLQPFLYENYKYAKLHNYNYLFVHDESHEMAPYWSKIYILRKFLHPKYGYDYIMFIDTDAVVNYLAFNRTIESLFMDLDNEQSFIYCKEFGKPKWFMNSGFIILKNTKMTKQIMGKWITGDAIQYINLWNYVEKPSTCVSGMQCNWNCKTTQGEQCEMFKKGSNNSIMNDYYEQGFFQNHFIRTDQFDLQKYLYSFEWDVCGQIKNMQAFVHHFYWVWKTSVLPFIFCNY